MGLVRSYGMGFAPGYQSRGYCPGTNNPNWMSFPDGSFHCVTDPEMMQLAMVGATPVATLKGEPDLSILGPGGTRPPVSGSSSGVQSYIDTATAWVKENPLLAAGIAAAVVLLVVRR